MSELWIPQPDKKPDMTNLYDMMLVFQEQIDSTEEKPTRFYYAQTATVALARMLHRQPAARRRVLLGTDFAIIDANEDLSDADFSEGLGIVGTVTDIHCVTAGDRIPFSLSLDIDVVKTIDHHDLDRDSYLHSRAITPINSINYIETLAS